jgi:hypothetical protein
MADVVNDTFTHLLQPDTILPVQYFAGLRRKGSSEPERRLVIAVLEDAVECFQKHLFATHRKPRVLFSDAEEWFESTDRSWPYSFENVCELLQINADYMRAGLAAWKHQQLQRRGAANVVALNCRTRAPRPSLGAELLDTPLRQVACR